ncbi:hypothetical protein [Ottowia sp.]|uniref:hypothetical protein n=1 Tax=Ottowia sp. TaxID=1898956 RepID=UPI0025F951DE|nr:hypothetical protein [Ottowia sp.]MBK6616380.1 hypothetical protein [Ottowia sp.]
MAAVKFDSDEATRATVEAAAKAACEVLDEAFPGWDAGGITSNFQGMLGEALTHMLKGRSLLDRERGHTTLLPALLLDDSLFGTPWTPGEAFLVTKAGEEKWQYGGGEPKFLGAELLVLQPDSMQWRPIERAGDAWTSFEAAAAAGARYLKALGCSIEEAQQMGLKVQAVEFDPASTSDVGYVLAGSKGPVAA